MGIVENLNIDKKGFIDLDVDKSIDIVEEISGGRNIRLYKLTDFGKEVLDSLVDRR